MYINITSNLYTLQEITLTNNIYLLQKSVKRNVAYPIRIVKVIVECSYFHFKCINSVWMPLFKVINGKVPWRESFITQTTFRNTPIDANQNTVEKFWQLHFEILKKQYYVCICKYFLLYILLKYNLDSS